MNPERRSELLDMTPLGRSIRAVDWCECADPERMLREMGVNFTARQLRYFALAACKSVQHLVTLDAYHHAIEIAERDLVSGVSHSEWTIAQNHLDRVHPGRLHDPDFDANRLLTGPMTAASWICMKPTNLPGSELACLLREVIGNPFSLVNFGRVIDDKAVSLATSMHDRRWYSGLPALADHLEDCGCTDQRVLGHCRQTAPHHFGCWVVECLRYRNGVARGSRL